MNIDMCTLKYKCKTSSEKLSEHEHACGVFRESHFTLYGIKHIRQKHIVGVFNSIEGLHAKNMLV